MFLVRVFWLWEATKSFIASSKVLGIVTLDLIARILVWIMLSKILWSVLRCSYKWNNDGLFLLQRSHVQIARSVCHIIWPLVQFGSDLILSIRALDSAVVRSLWFGLDFHWQSPFASLIWPIMGPPHESGHIHYVCAELHFYRWLVWILVLAINTSDIADFNHKALTFSFFSILMLILWFYMVLF